MDDVARSAGVSRALVSLVMRGSDKVSEQRRTAVLKAAAELGYRPNAAARNLAQRFSNTIGVVISDLHNTFFADIVDGIHERATEEGMRLSLNTSWLRDADERRAIDQFLENRVDAIIVVGGQGPADVLIDTAKQLPVVSVGEVVHGIDTIVNDDELGAALVVDHLVELGHKDIVHIDGGAGAGADRRRRGFISAMERYGLQPRVIRGDFTDKAGVESAELLIDEGTLPTAIFAANDLAALGAMDCLEDHQLRVPADISIVGYDNTAIAGLHHISLTTVNQPRVSMGRQAFDAVFERLDGGRREAVTVVVQPTLVDRSTTGPCPTLR